MSLNEVRYRLEFGLPITCTSQITRNSLTAVLARSYPSCTADQRTCDAIASSICTHKTIEIAIRQVDKESEFCAALLALYTLLPRPIFSYQIIFRRRVNGSSTFGAARAYARADMPASDRYTVFAYDEVGNPIFREVQSPVRGTSGTLQRNS